MNLLSKKIILLITILLLGFALVGCMGIRTDGMSNPNVLTESVDYEKLESIDVEIKMGVGELNIMGGSKDIFEGDFIYTHDSWKPEIDYKAMGGVGHLRIKQPSNGKKFNIGNQKYLWNIGLNDESPMDIKVELGVGTSTLFLGSLNLQSAEIEMGVGEARIDLQGDWEKDVNVEIQGGVGSATIFLPKNVGVIVKVEGGIGSVDGGGLSSNGKTYTNDLYNKSPVTLSIDVEAGIGEVKLK